MDKDEREDRLRFLEEELKKIADERKLLVNEDQKELLYEVFNFLLNRADDEDDRVFTIEYKEKDDSVEVSARLLICYCSGYREVESFRRIINKCSEFTLEPCDNDGVFVIFLIPHMFSRLLKLAR